MTRTAKIIGTSAVIALMGLALSACGKLGPLEPRAGAKSAPLAYGQSQAAETDSFTTPSVQARPGRSDELLRRSERRSDDPFDLPPGEVGEVAAQRTVDAPEVAPVAVPQPKSTPKSQ
jgi:predicted small lipoprotein YifL